MKTCYFPLLSNSPGLTRDCRTLFILGATIVKRFLWSDPRLSVGSYFRTHGCPTVRIVGPRLSDSSKCRWTYGCRMVPLFVYVIIGRFIVRFLVSRTYIVVSIEVHFFYTCNLSRPIKIDPHVKIISVFY